MAKAGMIKTLAKPGKSRKKTALGKGLGALIPDMEPIDASPVRARDRELLQCSIELIHPNRFQPRLRFKEEELAELSDSIRQQGVLQPLLVRRQTHGYELVAGERRLRAAKRAGLKVVPVLIKEISDAKMLEISIVENIQRANLNPVEEAEAYHRLITEFSLTQEQAAERVGKSRSAVANFLRLRQLSESIKASILEEKLSMGHARALLGLENAALQHAAWRQVMAKGLSVRETELLIKRLKKTKVDPPKAPPESTRRYWADLAEGLSRHFGTKVNIKRSGQKGRVEIEFYSDQDLERLLNLLNSPL